MRNPPPPPKTIPIDLFCVSGYGQILPVKNQIPVPPILSEEEEVIGQ